MTSLAAVRRALGEVEGRPFTAIGRAATLVWLTFGEDAPWVDPRGERRMRRASSLHLQCRWRLTYGAAAVVQEGDLFLPGARAGAAFEAGGEIGTARFDDRAGVVMRAVAADVPVVEQVWIGDEFDLRLTLSTGMSLEVFPSGRRGREDWRFLGSADGGRHCVVEGGSAYTV